MTRGVRGDIDQRKADVKRRWHVSALAEVFRLPKSRDGTLLCPQCRADLKPREDGQGVRCQGCQIGFDVLGLLQANRPMSFIQALRALEQTRTPEERQDRQTSDMFGGGT